MVKIHVPKGPVEAAYESPDAKSSQCPENHPDFATIRVVSRVVLFVLHKCWMTCGVSFVTVFVVYWYCSSVLALLLLFFSLSGLVYQLGDWLLYHPEQPPHSRLYVPSPSLVGLPCWEAPPVHTRDGLRLHALFVRQPPDRFGQAPTLLYLHGNAGNIGHRLHNVAGLFHQCGCNVLLVEYRGYGRSEGTPSEEGLYRDAQAGLDFLAQHPGLDATKLLVFGRSLGGAVALDLASRPEHACRLLGIVVENTFCSVPEVGRLLFGWLRWLPDFCFKSQFRSIDKVPRVRVPVLFLSGLSDALVPPSMTQRLYQNCGSPMKRLATFESGTHNETWLCKGYYPTLSLFINDLVARQKEQKDAPEWPSDQTCIHIPADVI
ncbi:protein ABHD13-like [Ixodes scapularis]|uniref:protein ABHD13 n=1 Tax=Ixodes scapularis TaxID=6945 RepID=UPI0011618406|nr:protein ABHD13 [Ixodes scapularis]XP_042147981.1 protein ABHD13-like [Ixodes scapularis]